MTDSTSGAPVNGSAAGLVVVKVGGRVQSDPALPAALAEAWTSRRVAGVINRHPERILFGTDCVSPAATQSMLDVFHLYDPVWKLLTPEASRMVRLENHARIFDEAKRRTREWERANVPALRRDTIA